MGVKSSLSLLIDVAKGAFVIEADQLAVVFVFVQFEMLGGKDLAECLEMQRLAVDEHAVEIKQHGGGPNGHAMKPNHRKRHSQGACEALVIL